MPSGVDTRAICKNEGWSKAVQRAGTDSRQGRSTDVAAGGLQQGDTNTDKGAGYRNTGESTVHTAGIKGMVDTIQEGAGDCGTEALFGAMLQMRGHHLGDLFNQGRRIPTLQELKRGRRKVRGAAMVVAWVMKYRAELGATLNAVDADWQRAPRKWEPKNLEGPETTAVIGGRSAKTTRT